MDAESAGATGTDPFAALLDTILDWAGRDGNVRAVVLTGSAARGPGATDRYSDRDIEIFVVDPAPLLADDGWFRAFAPVMVHLPFTYDDGSGTRLVFYEGGRKVDFTVAPVERLMAMGRSGSLPDLYRRGFRSLLDKDGHVERLPARTDPDPLRNAVPTQATFDATVHEYWFEALHMPTCLARGELWVARFRDWTMKEMLLRMLEWHAQGIGGPDVSTWYIGTKMRHWVAPDVWAELHDCFGPFGVEGSWRSLRAANRLFDRISRETAAVRELTYDGRVAAAVAAYLDREDPTTGTTR